MYFFHRPNDESPQDDAAAGDQDADEEQDGNMYDDESSGPEPVGEPVDSRPIVMPNGAAPPHLVAAFNFVALCNASMGLRCWPSIDGDWKTEVHKLELHPAQEGAFRLACQALGNYFIKGK